MRKFDLAGEWTLRKADAKKSLAAWVPGCVHVDLMTAKEIENPLVCDNLLRVDDVTAAEWEYEKVFPYDDLSEFDRVVLRFEGLDGCASVSLNGKRLGTVRNFFAPVEYDVRDVLRSGKNELTVRFAAAGKKGAGALRQPGFREGVGGGVTAPTVGIWRGAAVMAFKKVRVKDVAVRQVFAENGALTLDVVTEAERYDPELHLEILVRLCYKGNILHEARDILTADTAQLRLAVKNPQLWWPAGMGEQPLYELTVDVLEGRLSHEHVSLRIGLRDVRCELAEADGQTVPVLTVNGERMVAKGASWLPADVYVARPTRMEYARLVKAVSAGNMNMLRVWGGGIYESDAFYDLCDEYGVCVWQDVMLSEAQAEAPRPETLAAFGEEVRGAAARLRHHPSLVLWGGGAADGRGVHAAYEAAAAEALRAHDPERAVLPATPHISSMARGGGALPPSYPAPCVVNQYLEPEERNVSHPVCAFHSMPSDAPKRMYTAFLERFLLPFGFDNTLWLSQIQHALALREMVLAARAGRSAPEALMYWHFNTFWPGCCASNLDYEGRWKAAHYMARRLFAARGIGGEYDAGTGTVRVHVFNDSAKPFKGEAQWRITHMDGTMLGEGTKKVSVGGVGREQPLTVKVTDHLRKAGAQNVLMWLYLMDVQGNQLAWDVVPFCTWREMVSRPPRIRVEIRNWDENSFAVTLTSHHPALWVWLSLEGVDARCEDNFFCLEPAKPFRVRVTPIGSRMKLDQFRQVIRIGSLRDTWQDKLQMMKLAAAAKKTEKGGGK